MLEVIAVGLLEGSEGFTEVLAVVVLSGIMDVGKDNECSVIVVEAEVVGGDFVDGRTELFHVDLEGFSPVKLEVERTNLQHNHLLFSGTFGGSGDGLEELGNQHPLIIFLHHRNGIHRVYPHAHWN